MPRCLNWQKFNRNWISDAWLKQGVLLFALSCASASMAWGAGPDDCALLRKHGRLPEANSCYETLTASKDAYQRAEGFCCLAMYDQANNEFRSVVAQSDKNAMYRVRWGMLLHERFNNKDADDLFNEALQRDPKNARAFLGLAIVSADGFDSKAIGWVGKAIDADPKLAEAHELLAKLLLEDSDTDKALAEADEALKISPEALDAMSIHAAAEVIADRSPDEWLAKVKQVNPDIWRSLCGDWPLSGAQLSLRGRHRLLPQGRRAGSPTLAGAFRTWHRSHANGSGG